MEVSFRSSKKKKEEERRRHIPASYALRSTEKVFCEAILPRRVQFFSVAIESPWKLRSDLGRAIS
jgi:hypothetical protein